MKCIHKLFSFSNKKKLLTQCFSFLWLPYHIDIISHTNVLVSKELNIQRNGLEYHIFHIIVKVMKDSSNLIIFVITKNNFLPFHITLKQNHLKVKFAFFISRRIKKFIEKSFYLFITKTQIRSTYNKNYQYCSLKYSVNCWRSASSIFAICWVHCEHIYWLDLEGTLWSMFAIGWLHCAHIYW